MVAPASLTLTITQPNGSPYQLTDYLAYKGHSQSFTITQNFGRQGDTAVIPLADDYNGTPHIGIIGPLSRVSVFDNNCGKTLFAGVASDPCLTVDGPNRNEWTLNCTDFTYYADNSIVRGIFNGMTADQVVIALTQEANCGITAASVANGGFVTPGPVLPNLVLNYMTLSAAWRKLAVLAGASTPYGWYVDENLALHFYDASSAVVSGVTFTTSPTVSGSTTQGHIIHDKQDKYEWDGTAVHNRILVQGATQTIRQPTTGPPTDTWLADGVQQAWPLRYFVSGTPTLKAGGVRQTVTLVSPGTQVPYGWSCQQNANGQYFLYSSVPPYAGTVLETWYSYQVPVVAQATDYGSVANYAGPNGGIFSEFVSDSTLTTVPMALARAQQERNEYSYAAERFTFTTSDDFLGWVRAGEVCTISDQFIPDSQSTPPWNLGISDPFLVTANTVTFGTGGYRRMQVTAVRLF